MKNNYQVVLVDGSSYLFRAYHALPQLVSSKGQATGAIKGVISMIRKLIAEYPDSHIAVVFDAKGKSFRNEIYKDYKANRPPMPDELRSQIEPIHNIIRLMGLPILVVDHVEADDVIGTLATQATAKKMDVLVSTGDKDMAQLVTPHVTLINTMTDTLMDGPGVEEKFGVRADQIIDYLALVGDTSDNIPGVPKCGPKTAVKWLQAFESLNGVMANAESVKGKVGEYLRESLEFLPMSYELATIKKDLELEYSVDELAPSEPDSEGLLAIFTELEFRPWVNEINSDASADTNESPLTPTVVTEYETVFDETQLDIWLEKLAKADAFAFDTETTSIDYMEAKLVGLSFCCEAGKAAYVPMAHNYEGAPVQLAMELVLSKIRPLLENPEKTIIGQNLKYDISVMARHGVSIKAKVIDTMLESYVLNSVASRHNMDDLALNYLGLSTVHFEDIAGKGAKQLTFNQIVLDKAGHYAAEDADITFRLHQVLWPRLQAEGRLASVYQDIEIPLVPILSDVERGGVLLDE
ncbi:MAG: DNA polymerase I, partial [Gammaproteobacteria bacterium]|nr:DNA polymerase I [Gammaproteobacteria bacterium]